MSEERIRKSCFRFKRFEISDSVSRMKVGTDGVLLGAWTDISGALRIVDAGCGTGLIALMLAQRAPLASITGIEIDPEAAVEAQANADASPWSSRLRILTGDFCQAVSSLAPMDLLVSNPPYFSEGLHSPDPRRAGVRHEASLSFSSLLRTAPRILSPEGRLAMISPSEREADIEFEAALAGMSLRRKCRVESSPRKGCRRIMWEFGLCTGSSPVFETLQIHDSDGGFTPSYISLTKEFYLNF